MNDTGSSVPFPEINIIECKGCGRCMLACPREVLSLSEQLNDRGYHFAVYKGSGCIGCANCFYTCPEPGVYTIHIPARKGE